MKPIEFALSKKPGEKYTTLESIIMAWNVKHPLDAEEAAAELAALRARVGELERLLQDIQKDNEAAHGEGGGLWSPNGEFEKHIKAALAKGAK